VFIGKSDAKPNMAAEAKAQRDKQFQQKLNKGKKPNLIGVAVTTFAKTMARRFARRSFINMFSR